jgi:hypothetical protein
MARIHKVFRNQPPTNQSNNTRNRNGTMTFEEQLTEYLDECNMSLTYLTHKTLIHRTYFEKWFSGMGRPTETQMILIVEHLRRKHLDQPFEIMRKLYISLGEQQ